MRTATISPIVAYARTASIVAGMTERPSATVGAQPLQRPIDRRAVASAADLADRVGLRLLDAGIDPEDVERLGRAREAVDPDDHPVASSTTSVCS